jgi:hypothetical protein
MEIRSLKRRKNMESIEKFFLSFLVSVVIIVCGFVHACDIVKNQKIIGVIESIEYLSEKRASWWETGERYERLIKVKMKTTNGKEAELFLRGNKEETTLLQGGKYFIKFRREDNKIVGKALVDD